MCCAFFFHVWPKMTKISLQDSCVCILPSSKILLNSGNTANFELLQARLPASECVPRSSWYNQPLGEMFCRNSEQWETNTYIKKEGKKERKKHRKYMRVYQANWTAPSFISLSRLHSGYYATCRKLLVVHMAVTKIPEYWPQRNACLVTEIQFPW